MRPAVLVLLIAVLSFSQDYLDDIGAVRAILDSNGATVKSLDAITKSENGRVVFLDLGNPNVSGTFLTMLTSDIGKLTALRVLILKGNEIQVLPSEIGNLTELKELDLASNDIGELPASFTNLKSLEKLDLRSNEIAEFPSQLLQFPSLWYLHLRGNRISYLPEAISGMTSLRELYLQNNRLTSLPKGIMKLNLQYYELLDNRLCSLPSDLDAWMRKKDKRYRDFQKCVGQ